MGQGQGHVFGPGRGSGAGSMSHTGLRITELDPLEYDLLFETILKPRPNQHADFDMIFRILGAMKSSSIALENTAPAELLI